MKKNTLLFLILFSLSAIGQEVKNINFEQLDNKIIITYDLYGTDLFDVNCFYSIDGGMNFIELKSVTGDIGSEIKKGKDKQIIWDIFKDTDGIKGEIQFKVIATNLKVSNQFYISFGIGCIYLSNNEYLVYNEFGENFLELNIGKFGRKRFGIGLGLAVSTLDAYDQFYNVDQLIDYDYYYRSYQLRPIVTYKIVSKDKYQLIGSFKTPILTKNIHHHGFESYGVFEDHSFTAFNNLSLELIQNYFNHFQITIGLKFEKIKNKELDNTLLSNIEDINNLTSFTFGIGYTF